MFSKIRILSTALFICTLFFLVAGCSDPSSEDDNTVLVAVTVDSGMTNTKINDTVVEDGKSYRIEVGPGHCHWTCDGWNTRGNRTFYETTTEVIFDDSVTHGDCIVK